MSKSCPCGPREACSRCSVYPTAPVEGPTMGAYYARPCGVSDRMETAPHVHGAGAGAYGLSFIRPDKTFTRADVLLVLRAIEASRGGVSEAIAAFERME